ncbi:hypothetical protein C4D60_Mb07t01920 [Musa balbisiana]|uniref:Uncharacterized protein n=1 Tax=Musa balbisiana TaxID=52838 RepID=A0A4S8JCR8_MUSBA|nr:hypothetical protein C4D60_Mb07t01920 [Musa balbisiana]
MNNLFRFRSEIQERQVVAVPDLPGRPIEIPRAELPEFLLEQNHMSDTWDRMKKAQLTCHGVVVNTFYGFEPEYCDDYRRVEARQAWFVGPVALASCGGVERGGGTAAKEDGGRCMAWLDTREEGSVLFVCFGGLYGGFAAGKPMLTWPLVFEQFINERLVVKVAGAGKRVWEGQRSEAEHEKTVVPGEAIARAVSGFMKAGGEGETARKKAMELSVVARAAVAKGGPSPRDLDSLIDELLATRVGATMQDTPT